MKVGGLISGLDVDTVVDQLIALETKPIQLLQQRQAQQTSMMTSWATMDAKLQAVLDQVGQFDEKVLQSRKVTVSSTDALSITASSTAAEGSYEVSIAHLANAHRVASDLQATDYAVSALAAGDIQVTVTDATGTATTSTTVSLTEGMTLTDIAAVINDADAGVIASIIDNRLVLERDITGQNSTIQLADLTGGALGELGVLDSGGAVKNELVPPQDALFYVNGLTVTRESNVVDDVIAGLTFTLKAETASSVTASVQLDVDSVVQQVKSFVKTYNDAMSAMETGLSKDGKLRGESLLIRLRSRLRLALSNPLTGATSSYDRPSVMGIDTEKDGTLSLDETKLRNVLQTDPDAVQALILDETDGLKTRLTNQLDPYLKTDGLIDQHRDFFQKQVDNMDDQIDRFEQRLEMRRQALYSQFTAMEQMLNDIKSQGDWLMAQLGYSMTEE